MTTEGAEYVRPDNRCPAANVLAGRCVFPAGHTDEHRWQNGTEALSLVRASLAEKENANG